MFFLIYTLLLLLGGIAMVAVGVAVKEQGTGSRILNVVVGLAFFGYGFYLLFLFDGDSYRIFFYVFVLPILLIVRAVKARKEAREQARLDQLQNQVRQLQKKADNGSGNNANGNAGQGDGYYENGSSSGSGPVSSCATGVEVGPNTSCAFAINVAGEYGSNPGASLINAYSPVTGEYYTMACGPWNSGTVCTGGNGAAVYLP